MHRPTGHNTAFRYHLPLCSVPTTFSIPPILLSFGPSLYHSFLLLYTFLFYYTSVTSDLPCFLYYGTSPRHSVLTFFTFVTLTFPHFFTTFPYPYHQFCLSPPLFLDPLTTLLPHPCPPQSPSFHPRHTSRDAVKSDAKAGEWWGGAASHTLTHLTA